MTWETYITRVEPDDLRIRGYPLPEIIRGNDLLGAAGLLVTGSFPDAGERARLVQAVAEALAIPPPVVERLSGDDISKTVAASMMADTHLAGCGPEDRSGRTAFALGRVIAYLAGIYGNDLDARSGLREALGNALAGSGDPGAARMLEAMAVASVDHGVTPPSAQATRIAASVRAAHEVAVASGIAAITDVHGGAGAKAAEFFRACVDDHGGDLDAAIRNYREAKRRIPGLGHRVHKKDPRREALWALADDAGISGECVALSRELSRSFQEATGKDLPINVDGVIGAIIADMGLDATCAKAVFILGRTAGLSAHYFEELDTQRPMRRIDFSGAVYAGPGPRELP